MKKLYSVLAISALVAGAGPAAAQSAPPLTSVTITVLSSPAGGVENVSPTQTQTAADHGGGTIKVKVREIGIGSGRVAKMAGTQIDNSNSTSTSLCGTASNPTSCSSGQTIIGADVTYSIIGFSTGLFTYQSTSVNAPRNTFSDQITIR